MKISISELFVILYTMDSSLKINDDGKLFGFSKEVRENVIKDLIKQASHIGVNVDIYETSEIDTDRKP